MPKLIVIGGPTASGKTTLAIELAIALDTEIISADSRQCFREISIGTAKPSQEELSKVKHHFINCFSITQNVNAGTFCEITHSLLENELKHKKYVVITGGTGLYIKALLDGLDDLPTVPNSLRDGIKQEFLIKGLIHFQEELKHTDPEYYKTVDISNHARVLRAIELIRLTGRPFSKLIGNKKNTPLLDAFCFTTQLERKILYERINLRADLMIQHGLIDEVKSIYKFKGKSALNTVGYSEIFEFLEGKYDLKTTVDFIKQHSRNYAKRQVTWFKNQGDFIPLEGATTKEQIDFIVNSI
jgi:tRNA dimethylallyltransferase